MASSIENKEGIFTEVPPFKGITSYGYTLETSGSGTSRITASVINLDYDQLGFANFDETTKFTLVITGSDILQATESDVNGQVYRVWAYYPNVQDDDSYTPTPEADSAYIVTWDKENHTAAIQLKFGPDNGPISFELITDEISRTLAWDTQIDKKYLPVSEIGLEDLKEALVSEQALKQLVTFTVDSEGTITDVVSEAVDPEELEYYGSSGSTLAEVNFSSWPDYPSAGLTGDSFASKVGIQVIIDGETYQGSPIRISTDSENDGYTCLYLFGQVLSGSMEDTLQFCDDPADFQAKYEDYGYADLPFELNLSLQVYADGHTALNFWGYVLKETSHTLEISLIAEEDKLNSKYLPDSISKISRHETRIAALEDNLTTEKTYFEGLETLDFVFIDSADMSNYLVVGYDDEKIKDYDNGGR